MNDKKLSKKIKIGAVGNRIPTKSLLSKAVKVVFVNETISSYIASLENASLVSFEDASLVDLGNCTPLNSKKNFKRNRMF